MSNSVRPQRWQPTRLPHPWDSPGKNTGVGWHFLLQCTKVKSESEVTQLCPTPSTPWTAAHQAPPSMGFARQEYWSGLPLPSPGCSPRVIHFWVRDTDFCLCRRKEERVPGSSPWASWRYSRRQASGTSSWSSRCRHWPLPFRRRRCSSARCWWPPVWAPWPLPSCPDSWR